MNERRLLRTLHRSAAAMMLLTLAACGGAMSPPGLVGLGQSETSAPQRAAPPPAPPVPASEATFAFEPFVGTPGNTADSLAERIGEIARAEGLSIVRRIGQPASYRVKGHLSAVGDSTSSTIIYVFDVYDANNRRVHRFSGQETASAASGDPWGGVSSQTIDLLARRTVQSLKAWLTSART